MEEGGELTRAQRPTLDAVTAEFERLFEEMQTSEAVEASRALFCATPEQLGDAAVAQYAAE